MKIDTRNSLRALAATVTWSALLTGGLSAARAQNTLVTGKKITLPILGTEQNVGSLPMNLVLSPDGQFAISSDMGFRQYLSAVRTSDGGAASSLKIGQYYTNSVGLYYGIAIAPDGTVYTGQGAQDAIGVYKLDGSGNLTATGTIAAKKNDFPAGVALDNRGYLYVANNDPATFAAPGSVAVYNTATGLEVGRYTFTGSFYGTPNFPLAITALADGSKVYVSSQRDNAVYVLNTSNPAAPTLQSVIPSGQHPIGLILNKAQTRLFIANAHSDTVSVVNTANDSVVRTVLLRPDGARGLAGATPTGLALSPDEKTLYVTLGDMNAVAVVDTNRYQLKGYIPVGWYPTGVVVSPDNKRLLVANAKGSVPYHPNPGYQYSTFDGQYGLLLIEGTVQTLPVPATPSVLAGYTQQVIANNRITPLTDNPPSNPLAGIGLKAGKIKHVIYIIKENRTYDQILGDVATGNGDPSLTLFGANVTPNQHALAQRFVLLDNFYVCGEASGDGWPWSTQGIATEYVIKNLPYNYSGRGRNYDFEGQNNGYLAGGFPATDPDGNPLSAVFPQGAPPIPDVSEAPAGHIWDLAQRAGLSYRNYGFFYSFGVSSNGATILPDNYPSAAGMQPAGHDLNGKSDFDYRRYDNDFSDSDAPSIYNSLPKRQSYGKYNLPSRFAEWNREFQEMLANDPTGNSVPAFLTVRFSNDHTQGYAPGKRSPRSEVADNDYAVGQLVEAVSKSALWKNTAIVVLEDDAQDGADHVDSHRSPCYVISPYIKQGYVDHTFYNTDSALKTIELLLGLPAMSQQDAIATPILAWDTTPSNDAPFTAILPDKSIIAEFNPQLKRLSKNDPRYRMAVLSQKMNLDQPDSADPRLLNEIIWKTVKGANSTMPEPRRGLALRSTAQKPLKTASNLRTRRKTDGDDD